jgi:hypothetical protein
MHPEQLIDACAYLVGQAATVKETLTVATKLEKNSQKASNE